MGKTGKSLTRRLTARIRLFYLDKLFTSTTYRSKGAVVVKEEEKDMMNEQNYANMKKNPILKNPAIIPYFVLIAIVIVAVVYYSIKY